MNVYNGLSDEEVKKYRTLYGDNEIKRTKKNSFFKLFLESLGDPMIKILLIVLALKFVFLFADNDWFETLGVLIAIFLASFISSISEYGSSKAFESLLSKNSLKEVKVKRNNKVILININDIVVNDIVSLNSGDIVPADGVVVSGSVFVNESCINGESNDTFKTAVNGRAHENNKLYRGTIISNNECLMKVQSVGTNTIYGKIALELQEDTAESPLKYKLRHLAKIISNIGYVGAFLVFFSYLFSNIIIQNNFNISLIKDTITNVHLMSEYLISAITLAVTIIIVSVPEGLPMMVALVLSTNMKKMIKQNVLVRKLVGIETAGSINYLLSDKTGTITNGKMSVNGIVQYDGKLYENEVVLNKNPDFFDLIGRLIILNNDTIVSDGKLISGNSTDKALYSFMSFKCGDKVISKEVFDSNKKYSSVKTETYTYFKGASEVILPKCTAYYNNGKIDRLLDIEQINNNILKYTSKGYRVIVLAFSKNNDLTNLIFAGFAILKDEIRKDAKEGITLIEKAGVRLIMVTGDSIDTAMFIGRELGLIKKGDICLTSNEMSLMSDEELKASISRVRIVARAKPNDKSRLVRIIEELGFIVGMTGDGINDAPALKKASVGFAMGSGTEVAKQASDIVILDDNIKSISLAILYGRTIFKNIRKFIVFQLTMNIGAMSLSIIGPFVGIDTPVTSMQMLWINMIMDTLAGLAFAYEEPILRYMDEKPKSRKEHIINRYMYNEIFVTGLYSSLLCLLFLKLPFFKLLIRQNPDNRYFMTAFFTLFVFMGIFNAFNARTERYDLLYLINKNKMFIMIFMFVCLIQIIFIYYGGSIFRTYGLTFIELAKILLISFTVIPVDLLRKWFYKSKYNSDTF